MRMGLREANQSFSKAIKAVKSGKEVILTERGRPIAVIKSLEPRGDTDSTLHRLEAEGSGGAARRAESRCPLGALLWL